MNALLCLADVPYPQAMYIALDTHTVYWDAIPRQESFEMIP